LTQENIELLQISMDFIKQINNNTAT
jgi:hypothetical protein